MWKIAKLSFNHCGKFSSVVVGILRSIRKWSKDNGRFEAPVSAGEQVRMRKSLDSWFCHGIIILVSDLYDIVSAHAPIVQIVMIFPSFHPCEKDDKNISAFLKCANTLSKKKRPQVWFRINAYSTSKKRSRRFTAFYVRAQIDQIHVQCHNTVFS